MCVRTSGRADVPKAGCRPARWAGTRPPPRHWQRWPQAPHRHAARRRGQATARRPDLRAATPGL